MEPSVQSGFWVRSSVLVFCIRDSRLTWLTDWHQFIPSTCPCSTSFPAFFLFLSVLVFLFSYPSFLLSFLPLRPLFFFLSSFLLSLILLSFFNFRLNINEFPFLVFSFFVLHNVLLLFLFIIFPSSFYCSSSLLPLFLPQIFPFL